MAKVLKVETIGNAAATTTAITTVTTLLDFTFTEVFLRGEKEKRKLYAHISFSDNTCSQQITSRQNKMQSTRCCGYTHSGTHFTHKHMLANGSVGLCARVCV